MSNILKGLKEGLADEFMKMAREKGYNARQAGTPEQERERTQQMMAQRAKEREAQEKDIVAKDIEKLPELKAEYDMMLKRYNSLGGNNWQYADREQNLTDNERLARSMEPQLNQLRTRIARAEKYSNVSEAKKDDEADYGPDYQAMVKRVGQMAKEGPRKTVWDPVKRVYKTVPVNPPKEQGVAEGVKQFTNELMKEGISERQLAEVLYGKLERRYPDIVSRYGHEVVGDAIIDVASVNAGIEELGSGDLNNMIKEIIKKLENYAIDEGQIYAQGGGYGEGQRWYKPKDDLGENEELDENLRKWFKEKWVRFGPDGKIRGACARGDDSEGKPKCLPQAKAHSLGKKGRKYAASKKRREDPNPERRGPAKNVATKKKSNEGVSEGIKNDFEQAHHNEVERYITAYGTPGEYSHKYDAMGNAHNSYLTYPGRTVTINTQQYGDRFGHNVFTKKEQDVSEEQLDELKCWPGYTRVQGVPAGAPGSCKKKTNEEELEEYGDTAKGQKMLTKVQKRAVDRVVSKKADTDPAYAKKNKDTADRAWERMSDKDLTEEKCPECGGPMFSDLILAEKKDACYHKVRSRYKVWPSAYASGALVQCRKKGAANWGNKSKNESMEEGALGAVLGKAVGKKLGAIGGIAGAKLAKNAGMKVGKVALGRAGSKAGSAIGSEIGDIAGTAIANKLKNKMSTTKNKGSLWRVLMPRGMGGHAQRFYVVRGYDNDMEIWRNDIGAGDFINQRDAEAKANELNRGTTEAKTPQQQAAIAISMKKAGQKPKGESAIMKGIVDETLGTPYPGTYEQETDPFKRKGPERIRAMTYEEEQLDEKWSEKYKRSIDCSNPKGFSQKAHCQGRKKNK